MQNVIMFPICHAEVKASRHLGKTRQDSSLTHTTIHVPASNTGEHQPGDVQTSAASSLHSCFTDCPFGTLRSFSALTHFLKTETSSDNCSYFYGLIHLHIWSKLEISRQLFETAKNYPSAAPLLCANLHDINIYTITVTILQWRKLSHFKGSIFKEHNALMAVQL